jgi:hypothetical protein
MKEYLPISYVCLWPSILRISDAARFSYIVNSGYMAGCEYADIGSYLKIIVYVTPWLDF